MPRQYKLKWKYPTDTPTYNSWRAMRNRVLSSAHPAYAFYKDKTICDRWFSYDNFYEDMGERPSGTTLDRIDGNKGYSPDNCRWATHSEQQNNKASLSKVTFNGKTLTIGQWATELGLSDQQKNSIYKRHSKYGANTFEELFVAKQLMSYRRSVRKNLCSSCGTTKSCKWRQYGKQCNTCYGREYRNRLSTPPHSRNTD